MSQLMLGTTLSALAAVRLACSLKVSFLSNHNLKYFRAVQSLIRSPFERKEEGLKRRRRVNSTASVFVVARLSQGRIMSICIDVFYFDMIYIDVNIFQKSASLLATTHFQNCFGTITKILHLQNGWGKVSYFPPLCNLRLIFATKRSLLFVKKIYNNLE